MHEFLFWVFVVLLAAVVLIFKTLSAIWLFLAIVGPVYALIALAIILTAPCLDLGAKITRFWKH